MLSEYIGEEVAGGGGRGGELEGIHWGRDGSGGKSGGVPVGIVSTAMRLQVF